MAATNGGPNSGPGSLVSGALVAALLTAAVYLGLWGGSLPRISGLPTAALAVGGGLGVGIALASLEHHPTVREFVRLDPGIVLLAVILLAVAAGAVLFPAGLPTAAEVGLVVASWGDVAARAAYRRR